MAEIKLMKGNEAFAEAAIRAGSDAYFGYPITPQSEVIEYLMAEQPHLRTGMVVLQAESEVAAINMVYGAAGAGKRVLTSSSSPGISLKLEGVSYMAGAELPAIILNVVRGGPGLGTIQPSQADYFQAVKGGGHGDYNLIVLAPASVQEMADFVEDAYELAFKYRNPVMILADGVVGQMMEKVQFKEQKPRWTQEELIALHGSWATTGKTANRERNVITSLDLEAKDMEIHNTHLQNKYNKMRENEVRYEEFMCEDAEHILVAYGSSARVCQKVVDKCRDRGLKVGLLRPITLFPYPTKRIDEHVERGVKNFMSVEMSAGQMVEDVKLAVNGRANVVHFGRNGGMIPSPTEIIEALEKLIFE